MPFSIVRDELAAQVADVVILPANEGLRIDGGAGLSVGRVAGLEKLQAACDELGNCEVGHAVVTPAFDFPAKYLVHAVGPVWDGSSEQRYNLASAYERALSLAASLGACSVALPLISAGARGCPSDESLRIALDCVRGVLASDPDLEICIVLFSNQATRAGLERFPGLAQHIDDAYAAENENLYSATRSMSRGAYGYGAPEDNVYGSGQPWSQDVCSKSMPVSCPAEKGAPTASARSKPKRRFSLAGKLGKLRRTPDRERVQERDFEVSSADMPTGSFSLGSVAAPEPTDLKTLLDSVDEPFSTTLLAIIDARGLTDAEVYRRANISRQHFSKMRSNPDYQPTKRTVLALAIALHLTRDETCDLLSRAGFALSRSSRSDLIVEWFIDQGRYDIFEINEALFAYDQPTL